MSAGSQQPTTLAQWLHWQENLHPRRMDLSLDRVRLVAEKLGLNPFPAPVITVGGTNGKGSTVLLLEALLGGKRRVGAYTSPHLQRYTERVRIGGAEVDEATLCRACAAVEASRGGTPLTYFEFGTLAALVVFADAGVDVALLEVGLGGRLDATNVLDPAVAVVTSIGLDHCDWLGHDREAIATEKAGIFRAGVPAICADRDPPQTLLAAAAETDACLRLIGRDFDIEEDGTGWRWEDWQGGELRLPAFPELLPENLAGVCAALTAFGEPPTGEWIAQRLSAFSVPGRRQVIAGTVDLILDVCHNAEAARVFAHWLGRQRSSGQTHAVLGMLAGKPVAALVDELSAQVDAWYAASLSSAHRGLSGQDLVAEMTTQARVFETVGAALLAARKAAQPGDRIVICGSFYTVGAAMDALDMRGMAA